MKFLLERGAKVIDDKAPENEKLIPRTVFYGHYQFASLLLDYCVAITNFEQYEKTMLKAIADDQQEVARKIAKLCPARKETMAKAEHILRELAYEGDLIGMRRLIDATGVSVNNQDEDHDTPLFFALEGKKLDVAWFLINRGADIHAVGSGDETLLHCAARLDLELVNYLVEHGLDPNAKNKAGVTPLHHAVCAERLDIVQYLLDKGVEVNVADKDGIPLFLCAVFSCSPQTLEFLAAHGADCHAKDSKGLTAADFASVLNPKVLPCLLKLGVKTTVTVKKRDQSSRTRWKERDYDDVTAEWYYREMARECSSHSYSHQNVVFFCGNIDDDE